MKVYLVTDMEGVSGAAMVSAYNLPKNPAEAGILRLMMHEINAAVAGCFDGGATEVQVRESHLFDVELLDPRATLIRGILTAEEFDQGFDAIMWVGQHARSLVRDGVLAHTGSSRSIREVWINGEPIGEPPLLAGVAGAYGARPVFLSGDRAACQEAQAYFGAIETAEVMRGIGNHTGICLPAPVARQRIREGARRGLERINEFRPLQFEGEVEIAVSFKMPAIADCCCNIPGVRRIDSTTIAYRGDFVTAWKVCYLCVSYILVRYDRN
ncbi:MAG TPA: M55 family metallopeptidase [Chthoniobacteraceae bacterium]|nr:M55 family metallopeptidase [Chthoniobacteraceae bacterium]